MKEFIRIDIVTDLADGHRRLEKSAHGGSDTLLEMCAQMFEGRISRVQGWCEPAFGGNEGGVSLHPLRQSLGGRELGSKDRGGLRARVDFVAEDGRNEVGTLRKVPIKRADTNVCLLGNLSHRSVHSQSCEHRLRRLKQRSEIALRVGPHAPVRMAPRLDTIMGVFQPIAHHTPGYSSRAQILITRPDLQTEQCSV